MDTITFNTIRTNRVSEYIEKEIREAILDGRLKNGLRLPTEKEMAEQFGVSVVTLREALRALEILGLIEKKKGKGGGIYISKMDRESVTTSLAYYLRFQHLSTEHLLEVRSMIEPSVIRLVAGRLTADEIDEIEKNVSYCERKIAAAGQSFKDDDFFDLDEQNIEFHRLLGRLTNNPILSLTIDYVFDFLWDCEKNVLVPDAKFNIETVKEHRVILELLKAHDTEGAEKAMSDHLKTINKLLLDMRESNLKPLVTAVGVNEFREKLGLKKKGGLERERGRAGAGAGMSKTAPDRAVQ
jgi:GntR family transcriptional regulator, transcriptional repressor for pyruvate dehydrogenase complex